MKHRQLPKSSLNVLLMRYQEELSFISQELLKLRNDQASTLAALESRLDSLQLELENLRATVTAAETTVTTDPVKEPVLSRLEGFSDETPETGPGSLPKSLRLAPETGAAISFYKILRNGRLRRRYARWPGLLALYGLNLIVTFYLLIWESKHNSKIFPGR